MNNYKYRLPKMILHRILPLLLIAYILCPHLLFAEDVKLEFVYKKVVGLAKDNEIVPSGYTIEKGEPNDQGQIQKYIISTVPVKDRAHLVSMMDPGSFEEDITEEDMIGDKEILRMYDFAKDEESKMKELLDYAESCGTKQIKNHTITVSIYDTKAARALVDSDQMNRDFWPNSGIRMSNEFFTQFTDSDASNVLIHEVAHKLDNTDFNYNDYGHDGTHYRNEKTTSHAAFIEGWAEFNALLISSDSDVKNWKATLGNIIIEKEESTVDNPSYSSVPATDSSLTGNDLLAVEGINAYILYRIATEIPDGEKKIFDSFKTTNVSDRNLILLLRDLAKKNPKDKEDLSRIFKEETNDRYSEDEIKDIFDPYHRIKKVYDSFKAVSSGIGQSLLLRLKDWAEKNPRDKEILSRILKEETDYKYSETEIKDIFDLSHPVQSVPVSISPQVASPPIPKLPPVASPPIPRSR